MTDQEITDSIKVLIDDLHAVVFFLSKIQQEMIRRQHEHTQAIE